MSDRLSLGEFEFECGRSVPDLTVAYETYGEFDGDNAVLVCHALTGSQHVARSTHSNSGAGTSPETPVAGQARAWWDDVVGPGKAIDTTEYFVVCANVPGSCYGTTGPASEGPDGEPWGSEFPPVTVGDWTRSQRRLLDELGVGRLHAVVGGSVGGMNVLDWARRYPDDVRRAIPVAAAARLDPQCLALDAIARRAIRADPAWQGGDYYGTGSDDTAGDDGDTAVDDGDTAGGDDDSTAGANSPGDGSDGPAGDGDGNTAGDDAGTHPDDGLALARQLGHVMYLSKDSMERKFGRRAAGREGTSDPFPRDGGARFFPYREVESYLDYQADGFVDRFDANSYLLLTRAMDDFDLAAGYGSDADALAAFEGEALVLSFSADWHFTVDKGEELAEAFRAGDAPTAHHVVASDHGHDAFLVEPGEVGPPIRDFLAEGVEGRAVTDTAEGDAPAESWPQRAPVHNSLFSE